MSGVRTHYLFLIACDLFTCSHFELSWYDDWLSNITLIFHYIYGATLSVSWSHNHGRFIFRHDVRLLQLQVRDRRGVRVRRPPPDEAHHQRGQVLELGEPSAGVGGQGQGGADSGSFVGGDDDDHRRPRVARIHRVDVRRRRGDLHRCVRLGSGFLLVAGSVSCWRPPRSSA